MCASSWVKTSFDWWSRTGPGAAENPQCAVFRQPVLSYEKQGPNDSRKNILTFFKDANTEGDFAGYSFAMMTYDWEISRVYPELFDFEVRTSRALEDSIRHSRVSCYCKDSTSYLLGSMNNYCLPISAWIELTTEYTCHQRQLDNIARFRKRSNVFLYRSRHSA